MMGDWRGASSIIIRRLLRRRTECDSDTPDWTAHSSMGWSASSRAFMAARWTQGERKEHFEIISGSPCPGVRIIIVVDHRSELRENDHRC